MNTVAHRAARGHRTIRLPLAESDYERFMRDGMYAGAQLEHNWISGMASIRSCLPWGGGKGMCSMGLPKPPASSTCAAGVFNGTRAGRCGRWRRGL